MLPAVIYHNYIALLSRGERGNENPVKWASRHLGLVPASTEESTVWVAPPSLSGLPDILHHPGRFCQTSVFKQRLPFRPGQMRALWYLSESLQSKMRSLKYLGVSLLWLEATIWPKIPALEPLSARLHWNYPWVILTSMSLFVLFNWVLWQWVPPPCWIWGVVASLGQKPLLA